MLLTRKRERTLEKDCPSALYNWIGSINGIFCYYSNQIIAYNSDFFYGDANRRTNCFATRYFLRGRVSLWANLFLFLFVEIFIAFETGTGRSVLMIFLRPTDAFCFGRVPSLLRRHTKSPYRKLDSYTMFKGIGSFLGWRCDVSAKVFRYLSRHWKFDMDIKVN